MIDRDAAIAQFLAGRARSARLFQIPLADDFYTRPIALRNPIVFYEGHLPAFNVNTLWKRALGNAPIDPELEVLFARGIDPEDEPEDAASAWPAREVVRQYAAEADRRILDVLSNSELERDGHRYLHGAESVWTILEHELMHHETLLYMFHRIPVDRKNRLPVASDPTGDPGRVVAASRVRIPAGVATLGIPRSRFGWDNEFEEHRVDVPAFEVDRYPVTNAQFLQFVDDGGYRDSRWWSEEAWQTLQRQHREHPLFWERINGAWHWRAMFETRPMPMSWPVYVSRDEALAYCAWRGARLMSEGEFHRAAYGTPSGEERSAPWGDATPDPSVHGNFGVTRFDPTPVDAFPGGASAWGVDDLIGNGWEWTSTEFAPFAGFRPMECYPEYSADFFDGKHFVIKGASPVTDARLVRPSFRNWFRSDYPYVYAKFRSASSV